MDDQKRCCERQADEMPKPCCRRRVGGTGGGALVEPAALAALLYAGGYGYDIRKTILKMTDDKVDADVGGLYRALRKLEAEESVISRWMEDGSGPRRCEYELTAQGRELAEQWVTVLRQREELAGILAGLLESGLEKKEAAGSGGAKDLQ